MSEVMLQQTQVDRVVPRYHSFLAEFPTLAALAAAGEEAVLAEWSGLGYYRRARSLFELAREVVASGGELPSSVEELQRLPGIGPYTAAAVASLAFGRPEPVLDGNVLRVGARFHTLVGDPRKRPAAKAVADWVRSMMTDVSPAVVNEALMELGATVCTPSNPSCDGCPLSGACAAEAQGEPERYPAPRRSREPVRVRWVAVCVVAGDGRWLLRRVDSGPILRGLWLPPMTELDPGGSALAAAREGLARISHRPAAAARDAPALAAFPRLRVLEGLVALPPVKHTITHRRIQVTPVVADVADPYRVGPGWTWADPGKPGRPTSSLLAKLSAAVGSVGPPRPE